MTTSEPGTVTDSVRREILDRIDTSRGQPNEQFAGVSDDAWFWAHTTGSAVPAIASILPGMPEESVQVKWTGHAGEATMRKGFELYRAFRAAYLQHAGPLDTANVLDFGCGWGRIIRFFLRDVAPGRLTGTDVNDELIEFCRSSNRWCTFLKNGAFPPLGCNPSTFDLVYAFSVFSHFSESAHRAWIDELSRVLAPGGLLFVSLRPVEFILHCEQQRESGAFDQHPVLREMFLDADAASARYHAGEFCFEPYARDDPTASWGEACVPRAWIERSWPPTLELIDWFGTWTDLGQHIAVARTRP